MLVLPILAFYIFAHQVVATGEFSTLPEQLFLDIGIHEIVDNTTRDSELLEPWASDYVESIRQKRYGDAIWARYHMYGEVEDGLVGWADNLTVLGVIEEDAIGYRVGHPDLYAEALSFYAETSSEDSHATDVLDMLQRIGQEDAIELEKRSTELEKHKQYFTGCPYTV
ncbi:hypothetical protein N7513_005253 [Penicillium frequentans]|nr:hypothetical protein N7513_005253 [Penicillium glabrum]